MAPKTSQSVGASPTSPATAKARSLSLTAASKAHPRAVTPRPSPKRLQTVARTVAKATHVIAVAKGRPGDPKASAPKAVTRRTVAGRAAAARPSLPPPADVTTDDDWSRSPRLRGSDQEAADDWAPSLENTGQLVLHNSAAESMGSAYINGSLHEELVELRAENGSLKSQVSRDDRMVGKMEELMDRFQGCEEDQAARLLSVEERSAQLLSHEESQQKILDGAELLAKERSFELISSEEAFRRQETLLSSEIVEMADAKAAGYQSEELTSELAAARQEQSMAIQAISKARMQLAEKKGMIEEMSEFTEEGIAEVEDALSRALHESSTYEENAAAERAACESLAVQISDLKFECNEQGSPSARGSLRFGAASSTLTVASAVSVKSNASRPSVSFDTGLAWMANWVRLSSLLRYDACGQVLRTAAACAANRRHKLQSSDLQLNNPEAVEQLLLVVDGMKSSMTFALEEAEAERDMWVGHERQQQIASKRDKVYLENSMKEAKDGKKEVVVLKMQVAAMRAQIQKSRLSLQSAPDKDGTGREDGVDALRKSCAHYESTAAQEQAALDNCEAMVSSILAEHKTKANSLSVELNRVQRLEEEHAQELRKAKDELEARKGNLDDELNVATSQVLKLHGELAILKAGGGNDSTEVAELKAALKQAQRGANTAEMRTGARHIASSPDYATSATVDQQRFFFTQTEAQELVTEELSLHAALSSAKDAQEILLSEHAASKLMCSEEVAASNQMTMKMLQDKEALQMVESKTKELGRAVAGEVAGQSRLKVALGEPESNRHAGDRPAGNIMARALWPDDDNDSHTVQELRGRDLLLQRSSAEIAELRLQIEHGDVALRTEVVALRSALEKRIGGVDGISEASEASLLASSSDVAAALMHVGLQPESREKDFGTEDAKELRAKLLSTQAVLAETNKELRDLQGVFKSGEPVTSPWRRGLSVSPGRWERSKDVEPGSGNTSPLTHEEGRTFFPARTAALDAETATVISPAPGNQDASELLTHLRQESAELRAELLELMSTHVPADHVVTLRSEVESLASLLERSATTYQEELLSAQAGEFNAVIDANHSGTELRTAKMESKALASRLSTCESAMTPALGEFVLQALPSPAASHLTAAPRHRAPTLPSPAANRLTTIESSMRPSMRNGSTLQVPLSPAASRLQAIENTIASPARSDLTFQGPPSPASPSSASPFATEVLLIHFPDAPWPPPPEFQAELRSCLTSLGATRMGAVAIRLHKGSIIVELIGSRTALSELKSLPLQELNVLSYRVGFVRSSLPDNLIPLMAALEGPLASWEARTAALVAISTVDVDESEELTGKLSGNIVAIDAAVEACAALRLAVSSSETAEAAVKVAHLPGREASLEKGVDTHRPAAKDLTQQLRMQEEARKIAEGSRNAVRHLEDDRVNTAIVAAEAHLAEYTVSAPGSDAGHVVADAPEMSELHTHLTSWIATPAPHVVDAADTIELSKAVASLAIARGEVAAESAEVKGLQSRLATAEEASAELIELKASMVQLKEERQVAIMDNSAVRAEHVAEFQRLRETVECCFCNMVSSAAEHVAESSVAVPSIEADIAGHDEPSPPCLGELDDLLELQQLGQRLQMEESRESFQAGEAQSFALRLSEQEVVTAEVNSELTSLQAKYHAETSVCEQESALLRLRLEQCTLNCETLEASAHEEKSKDEQAQLALQDRFEECEDLQRATHAMQAQVALAHRRLSEHEAACLEMESISADHLMKAHSEARLESILAAHEASQLRSEAAHCHSLGTEVASSLATHAIEICDAKLSATKITADYEEACARLRMMLDNKEQIANELLTVRGELEQGELLLCQEQSLWLSARAEQEAHTRSLSELVASHAADLVELRKSLCLEEFACRSAEEACDRSAVTSAHAVSRAEESAAKSAMHASQASSLTRSSDLASHILSLQDSSRWEGMAVAETAFSRAMQTLKGATDVLMETQSSLQNHGETSVAVAMLTESTRRLQAASQALEVSQAELTRAVQEANDEVATAMLQSLPEMRTEKLLLVEAELASEKFTKATLYAEIQHLEIGSADEKRCRALESLVRKGEPTSMAGPILAQAGTQQEDAVLAKVLHELQEAEAAEASATQKFEQAQSLSSYPSSFVGSSHVLPDDTAVDEESIAAIEDENAAVQRELEQTMAEIRGLHEEEDSLHVSQDVGQLVLQASRLASQSGTRQQAVQAELKASADECSLWIAISNQRESRAEHWQQAAVTQAAEVRDLEGRLALEGLAVRQQAAGAHAAEVRELEGRLALEEAAWRSVRDGSAVSEHEHACGQLELEGLCAGLQQDTAVLGVRCLALTQELCIAREEAGQLSSLREELERKECVGAAENAGLEEELICSKMEAERTVHKLERRCLALTQELCIAQEEAGQLSSLREELERKECVGEAKHAGLEEELIYSKMQAETSVHKLERRLELLTSESVETKELSYLKMKAETTSCKLEARLELLTSEFDETKALCRAEMRAETATCRTSIEQMDGYMSSLQPEILEFQHALEERSAKAREREEALEQMVALESEKHRESSEMTARLTRELNEARSEQEARSSRSSEEIQALLSSVSATEVDRNEIIAHSSERSAALEHLGSALNAARAEEREATRKASELQVQVKLLQSSSTEVAQAAQATTASMRSQLAALFEQLDARGRECRAFEERAIQEESRTREWCSGQMRTAASHDHEVAQLKSVAAFKTAEAQRLASEMAAHLAVASADTAAGALDMRAFSESPGAAGNTAWQSLESMLEEETPIISSQTEALASDFEHMFSRLQAQLQPLMESSSHDPAVRELASRYELLRRSKDALLLSMPDAKTLAAHSDQLVRSKAALRSVLPRVAKLTAQVDELRESRDSLLEEYNAKIDKGRRDSQASVWSCPPHDESELEVLRAQLNREQAKGFALELQVNRGFEAEVELKRAQSEVESLQQVAEIHAQHSLKVHRLMCEDAQHRLIPQRRVMDGGTASPQRPATRRSSTLRAWQSSLENQSQALMERSLMLLNHSSETGGDADPEQPIAERNGLAPRVSSLPNSPSWHASPAGGARHQEYRTGT